MTNRTNEIKANRQSILASIPTPEFKEVDEEEEDITEETLEDSNASIAVRHVIYELEERNRRFQYLQSLEKGGGVTIIDIKGILEDLGRKGLVTQHPVYREFLEMVKDHYSNLQEQELDTDDFVVKVRDLLTQNAVLLKELVIQNDADPIPPEIPSFEIINQDDPKATGRNYWDQFVVTEETEQEFEVAEYDDKNDPEFSPEDDSDEIIEIIASTTVEEPQIDIETASPIASSPPSFNQEPRKRGRPRKLNSQPPPIVQTTGIKRKRGRPRKNMLIITTQNLEVLATEAEKKERELELAAAQAASDAANSKKRGRPPKKLSWSDSTDDPEYLPTITAPLPPFELFSDDLFYDEEDEEDQRGKKKRSRRRALFTDDLFDSSDSLFDFDCLDVVPDLSSEISTTDDFTILESASPLQPLRKTRAQGKTFDKFLPDELPLMEDTHQSNSDIESFGNSPSSLDSPMIGATLVSMTLPPFDYEEFGEESEPESLYDDDEDYYDFSDNEFHEFPIISPRSSPVLDDGFKRKRGRPRKKAEVPHYAPPSIPSTGIESSSELNKKTRHARNKINDFNLEDLLESSEDEKPKKKRRSSLDYGDRKSPKSRVRVRGVPLDVN